MEATPCAKNRRRQNIRTQTHTHARTPLILQPREPLSEPYIAANAAYATRAISAVAPLKIHAEWNHTTTHNAVCKPSGATCVCAHTKRQETAAVCSRTVSRSLNLTSLLRQRSFVCVTCLCLSLWFVRPTQLPPTRENATNKACFASHPTHPASDGTNHRTTVREPGKT